MKRIRPGTVVPPLLIGLLLVLGLTLVIRSTPDILRAGRPAPPATPSKVPVRQVPKDGVRDVPRAGRPAPLATPSKVEVRQNPNPVKKQVWTNPQDGSEFVWVPAGQFIMGSNEGFLDERPQRRVYLDGYWIGKYEVTVAQFRRFCEATGREMPRAPEWGWQDAHPVANVTWHDAAAYAEWSGCRLPTEAEWEKAARGADGRLYPWGNVWDVENCNNYSDHNPAGDGYQQTQTAPVGSYPSGASPYGCLDMAGNVWEWCRDWYSSTYYSVSPSTDPQGSTSGSVRVLRGGSWNSYDDLCRAAFRYDNSPSFTYDSSGFRLAR